MDDAARIIAELEAERDRLGLTYYRVAKDAGQSQIGVQRVLAGEEAPSLARILAIARAVGRTLNVSPLDSTTSEIPKKVRKRAKNRVDNTSE